MGAAIEIRVLGELEILGNGEVLNLPPSRKTRALLGFLALAQRPVRRDRLCELLWDLPDDPRGALRWSLSRLRALRGERELPLLRSDKNHVQVDFTRVHVDWRHLMEAGDDRLANFDVTTLESLESLCRGPLLDGLENSGRPEFDAWLLAERERVLHRRLSILETLVDRLADRPEQALVHARMRAELDPMNELAHATVIGLLVRSGNSGRAREYLQVARRLFEAAEVKPTGVLDEVLNGKGGNAPIEQAQLNGVVKPSTMRQVIRFCTARDGTRIAWSSAGQGPPVIKLANWFTHLEYDWTSPVRAHLLRFFARDHTLVCYDERGNGLSDREIDTPNLEAFVEDLESVAAAAGHERFSLLAISQGCAVAAAYATRYPDKVSRMIFHGGYAMGWRYWDDSKEVETKQALQTLVKTGWNSDKPTFRQIFTNLIFPGATPAQRDAFNEMQRQSIDPDAALKILDATGDMDARPFLGAVDVPVLVTHCRGDQHIPVKYGRELAARIPNARFVELDSGNHSLLASDPAWPRFMEEVAAFLEEDDR